MSYLYFVLVEWISLQTTSLFFTHHLRFSLLLYPELSGVIVLQKNHVSQFLRGNFFSSSKLNHFAFVYDVTLSNLNNFFVKHLKDVYCSHYHNS